MRKVCFIFMLITFPKKIDFFREEIAICNKLKINYLQVYTG